MIFLFGASVESSYDKELESEDYKRHREPERIRKPKNYRHQLERFSYKDMDLNNSSSDGEQLNSKKLQYTRHSITREHSLKRKRHRVSEDKNEQLSENHRSEEHLYSKVFCSHSDDGGEGTSKDANEEGLVKNHRRYAANMPEHYRRQDRRRESEDRSSSRRKNKVYSEEEDNYEPKPQKKHDKKQVKDRHLKKSDICRERTHSPSNWGSFRSKDQFIEKYSSEDLDSENDSDGTRCRHRSKSGKRRKYDKHSSQQRRSLQSNEHRYITSKVRKGDEESDESYGRWKVSEEGFLVEET